MTLDKRESLEVIRRYYEGRMILADDDVRTVLGKTELQLAPGVQFNAFAVELNSTIAKAVFEFCSPRLSNKEINNLQKAFNAVTDYQNLAGSLQHCNPYPPRIPQKVFEELEKYHAQIKELKRVGGPPPRTWQSNFYIRLLNLFEIAFGKTPTCSVSEDTGSVSDAINFVQTVIARLQEEYRTNASKFNDIDNDIRGKFRWDEPSAPALREALNKANRRRISLRTNTEEFVANVEGDSYYSYLCKALKS